MRIELFGLIFILLTIIAGCNVKGEKMSKYGELDCEGVLTFEQKVRIEQMKIFFGHHSVGSNILMGISDIRTKCPVIPQLEIKETVDPLDYGKPILGHAKVGKNKDPMSKINDFKNKIESGIGERVDIAFFKFCFVDIKDGTDIEALFAHYSHTLSVLEKKFPRVRFCTVTVPLTSVQTGLKAKIKKILNLPLWGESDNVRRLVFNQMLISKYGNQVFDLAKHEATFLDGRILKSEFRGQEYYALAPDFTDDGGHLNSLGRIVVASHLLRFLANLE